MRDRLKRRFMCLLLAVVPWAAGCGQPGRATPPSPADRLMFEHFARARELRTAVLMGDLDGVREPAGWLMEYEPTEGLPTGSEPYVDELRRQARNVHEATDLTTAARATSRVAQTCGECHRAYEIDLGDRFGVGVPREGDGVRTHMMRHSWASSRMWEGLVGPTDRSWRLGASTLLEEPVELDSLGATPRGSSEALADRIHALGLRANVATNPEARTELLAELWTTCGQCHRESR